LYLRRTFGLDEMKDAGNSSRAVVKKKQAKTSQAGGELAAVVDQLLERLPGAAPALPAVSSPPHPVV
jgi:hypothetical protein